jgi:hypothetical protein
MDPSVWEELAEALRRVGVRAAYRKGLLRFGLYAEYAPGQWDWLLSQGRYGRLACSAGRGDYPATVEGLRAWLHDPQARTRLQSLRLLAQHQCAV